MPSRSPQEDPGPEDEYQEEQEGVFVVREGLAVFIPVQMGIAGERYFEVLNGLAEGDRVITGPFDVVRNLQSGDPVGINSDTSDQANGLSSSSRGGFRLQFGR
jgi:HlyD family secretion protein